MKKYLTMACMMLMSTAVFAQQRTTNESHVNTIDFVYHVSQYKSEKSVSIEKLDFGKELLLRFSATSSHIVFQVLSIDRLNADKEKILETHYIDPLNSYLEDESDILRVTYKENEEYKGFTFIPDVSIVVINDLWGSDGEALKNRSFTQPDEKTEALIKGLNANKNFSHTQWGETDFPGKYNKLKVLLKQFRWKE